VVQQPAAPVEPALIVFSTADLPSGSVLYRSYDPAVDEPFVFNPLSISIDAEALPLGVGARGSVGRVVASGTATATPAGVDAMSISGRARPRGVKNPTDAELLAVLLAA
jgi:hypothetical protein